MSSWWTWKDAAWLLVLLVMAGEVYFLRQRLSYLHDAMLKIANMGDMVAKRYEDMLEGQRRLNETSAQCAILGDALRTDVEALSLITHNMRAAFETKQ